VVAILAVPLVLAKGEEPVPPAATAAPPQGAEAISAAVLAEQPTVRDYRERLSALKQRNPFEDPFPAKKPAEDAAEAPASGTGTEATAPVASGGETASSTSPAPAPDTSTADDSAPPLTAPETDASPPTAAPDQEQPKPEIRFYVGRVDIAFGPVHDTKVLEDVRELDFIPGDKNPVASFIGLAGNGEHAMFGLTPGIVKTRGDGSCAPKSADGCQFLRLGEGQVRYLETESGKTYKLKLLATHLVRIPDPRDD
jgi:hypothetical protein